MYTFTRGDEMDICIRGSTDLFRDQNEIDFYAKKCFIKSLDDHFKLCSNIV